MTTTKQKQYINALISEYESVDEDRKYYNEYMQQLGKTSLKELSTKEASDLIKGLIKIAVPLEMLCGKVILVEKDELMGGEVMGRLDECLHHCEIDVHECEYWNKED